MMSNRYEARGRAGAGGGMSGRPDPGTALGLALAKPGQEKAGIAG